MVISVLERRGEIGLTRILPDRTLDRIIAAPCAAGTRRQQRRDPPGKPARGGQEAGGR
ncbi:hypothetical protein [Actinoplanes sp. NPDC049599]|uniref:hypothetical protein n=1 Tax=Actinoplanes sp. NPDC049599 TaxID=3363903 RepID=UPI0037BD936B